MRGDGSPGYRLQFFLGPRLGWLPVSGRLSPLADAPATVTGLYTFDGLVSGEWTTLGESLRQLLLPAITLIFPATAIVTRFTRATLLETLGQD